MRSEIVAALMARLASSSGGRAWSWVIDEDPLGEGEGWQTGQRGRVDPGAGSGSW